VTPPAPHFNVEILFSDFWSTGNWDIFGAPEIGTFGAAPSTTLNWGVRGGRAREPTKQEHQLWVSVFALTRCAGPSVPPLAHLASQGRVSTPLGQQPAERQTGETGKTGKTAQAHTQGQTQRRSELDSRAVRAFVVPNS